MANPEVDATPNRAGRVYWEAPFYKYFAPSAAGAQTWFGLFAEIGTVLDTQVHTGPY
jgi:hypothetical protein